MLHQSRATCAIGFGSEAWLPLSVHTFVDSVALQYIVRTFDGTISTGFTRLDGAFERLSMLYVIAEKF
jgi:hypothetical protein